MATTTGGTTYVTSTDLVANYPTASLSLANRVDVVASGGPGLVKTLGYTITVADILGGNKFLYNSASPGTFTLPTSSLVDGMVVNVAQIGAGALTVSGGTIVGTTVTTAQYQGLSFVYVASGTTWYSIAPNATAPGLAIVTPTSIANSGGSASASGGAITFTGVSSISLNGSFTSTYDNYRIIATNIVMSSGSPADVNMRLRVAGTDNATASNYEWGGAYVGAQASNLFGSNNNQVQSYFSFAYGSSNELLSSGFDVFSPMLAFKTSYNGQTNGYTMATLSGAMTVTTAYDGFTIYPASGTFSGVVRVYGYKNS
jgi:hypothetical protein